MATKTKGSCLCKALTYEFTGAPAAGVVCHCGACKKISGSAFTHNLAVPRPNFSVDGVKASRDFTQQPSGVVLTVHFCPSCGTAIYKDTQDEKFSAVYLVQAGTVDEFGYDNSTGPVQEIWTTQRDGWVKKLDGAEQKEGF